MTMLRLLAAALVLFGAILFLPFQNTSSSAADDTQRYHIDPDGTVDWRIFNGYRRYHAICHTCHGPDGLGSSFAPNLTDSLKTMSYDQFIDTVVNGRVEVNTAADKRMPALGTDPNVMCYIDDIYAYLKARSDGVVARGRPEKHASKPKEAADAEASCMGPATGN
jgi:methanol metabolism-related c-type cytochrome